VSQQPFSAPIPHPGGVRIAGAKIFVRGIVVQAEIGVYDHEHGRSQPLVVEVELALATSGFERLADTINYENIAIWAREAAAQGHVKLVETFAEQVALACLRDPRVLSARVRVEKPEALAPAIAGVEVTLERS
jgi:7,8-dihydroneopterin aldolase/epimerase/oxygenase